MCSWCVSTAFVNFNTMCVCVIFSAISRQKNHAKSTSWDRAIFGCRRQDATRANWTFMRKTLRKSRTFVSPQWHPKLLNWAPEFQPRHSAVPWQKWLPFRCAFSRSHRCWHLRTAPVFQWRNDRITGHWGLAESPPQRNLGAFRTSFHDLVSKSLLISMRQRRGWQPALAMKQLAGSQCWLIWCPLWLNMAEDPLGQSPKCPSPAKCCSHRQVGDGQQLRSLKRHWMARGWAGLGNHATHCRFQEEASILKLAFTLFDNCHEQLWFLRPLLATSSQWQLESTGPTQC